MALDDELVVTRDRVADTVPTTSPLHVPSALRWFEDSGVPGPPDAATISTKDVPMNIDDSIQQLLSIDGAAGASLVDSESGMALAQGGSPGFDLGVAAAGNSNVVRAKLATMRDIGLGARIDDILITLDSQYHLINVLSGPGTTGLFVYLVLDRSRANLALARHRLSSISKTIAV